MILGIMFPYKDVPLEAFITNRFYFSCKIEREKQKGI